MFSAKEAFDKSIEGAQFKKAHLDNLTSETMEVISNEIEKRTEEGKLTAIASVTLHQDFNEAVLTNIHNKMEKLGYYVTCIPVEYIRTPINHNTYEIQIEWTDAYKDMAKSEKEDTDG